MSHDLDLRVYVDGHLFTCLTDHFQERVYINSLKTGLEINTEKPANLFLGVAQLSCTFPLYWVSTEDDLCFVARLGFLFEPSKTRLFQVATALEENITAICSYFRREKLTKVCKWTKKANF